MTAHDIIWLAFGAATYTAIVALFFLKLGVGLGRNFERKRNTEPRDYNEFADPDGVRPE